MTVMFCDLVGSTELSAQLDPEDMELALSQYQSTCRGFIEEAGGHIAQYLGDGLLVYFGYPHALEDHPKRAIRAGLEIVEAMRDLTPCVALPDGEKLRVRVGIHSGEVVTADVGGGRRSERLALGQTPNAAARIQGLAEPNTVVLSDATHTFASTAFDFEDMGEHSLKGLAEPIRVYRASQARTVRGRFESEISARAALVGRSLELERLVQSYERLGQGNAGAMLISGPAGMGKTHLAQAFENRIAADAHSWLVTGCSPDGRLSFLHPVIELIKGWYGIVSVRGADRQLSLLSSALRAEGLEAEAIHAIAQLLGIAPAGENSWSEIAPEQRKRLIFSAILHWLGALAGKRRLVLMIEDVQWLDASTGELFEQLLTTLADRPVLLMMTQRPGKLADWLTERAVEVMHLTPLSEAESRALIDGIDGGAGIPADVIDEIVVRAEGIPLFVEELTRTFLSGHRFDSTAEHGGSETGTHSAVTIPRRLRDLFTASLDRLGDTKALASIAAVIGTAFSVQLLSVVTELAEQDLLQQLEVLQREEIFVAGEQAEHYRFKHALIRDAATSNLLRTQLREYHRRVAVALEARFPDDVELNLGRLAHHWEMAGEFKSALRCFTRIADRSRSLYANVEAIEHYRNALRMVEHVPEAGSARCGLQESMGDVLWLTRRHADARAAFESALEDSGLQDNLGRARLLRKIGCVSRSTDTLALEAFGEAERVLGEPPAEEDAAWRQEWVQLKLELSLTHYLNGRVDEMVPLSDEIQPYIREFGTPVQRSELHNHMYLIELRRARYKRTPLALHHACAFVEAAEETGDLAQIAAASISLGLIMLDYPADLNEALRLFDRALALARQTGARASEIRALIYLASIDRQRGAAPNVGRLASDALELAEASNMQVYVYAAHGHLAWAGWRRGDLAAARRHGRIAADGWENQKNIYPFCWIGLLPLLAAQLDAGDTGQAAVCAEKLLDPGQQALPDRLSNALEVAVAAAGNDRLADPNDTSLAEAVRAAEELGYL